MRVIGGKWRGRRLFSPRGETTRPTADRAREALFSILAGEIGGASFLDVYAGSGAVGIEAASRGAGALTLIESSRAALATLRKNLDITGAAARVMPMEAARALEILDDEKAVFRIIFADPPWKDAALAFVLVTRSAAEGRLSPDGLLVFEHDRRFDAPVAAGPLVRRDSRRYGDTRFSFYGWESA
ncbi:16S rRNA (guanine(966)-N(2))-methyltransferase RsmD [bacterium]|nr:16S rRNA (guanine(966)-N(2))-methyltransferase RsmD [bacterium]